MSSYDPRRIPIIGDDIAQVGQVLDIIAQPCTPSPTIAVTAFFINLPVLIWSIVKPDPIDYALDRFGQRHHRKRKRRVRPTNVDVPDIPPGRGLGTAAWTGAKLLERIGWYFLIADITTDFAINWTSMAYQFSGCTVAGTPYGSITQTGTAFTGSGGGISQITNMTNQVAHIYTTSSGSIAKTVPGPWTFSGGFSQKPTGLGVPEATVIRSWIRVTRSGQDTDYAISVQPDDSGLATGSRAVRIYDDIFDGHVVRMFAETTPGPFTYGNARIQASGTTDNGVSPDP